MCEKGSLSQESSVDILRDPKYIQNLPATATREADIASKDRESLLFVGLSC